LKLQLVEEFVGANLGETITVEQMAEVARYSASRFWHLFRNAVGSSPCQYVIQRRLKRAMELLLNTDNSLVEIAMECGFSDQSHLIRLFKRHTGMTPKRMRLTRGMNITVS
jgi:AraC family transcriptional regulator